MLEAGAVLDARDETLELANEFNLAVPPEAEEAYQDADEYLVEALLLVEETREATQALVSGIEGVEAARSLTTKVGLIGADPEVVIDEAIDAYEANDFELAADKAAEAKAIISEAGATGATRLGFSIGGLLVLLAGFGWRRRRRRSKADLASPSEPGDDGIGQAAAPSRPTCQTCQTCQTWRL